MKLLFIFLLMTMSGMLPAKVSLKFASLAPKTSAQGKCLTAIRKDAYFNSGKEIMIKVYYGGQMGDETEMAEKIQYAALDGGAFTGLGLGKICSEARVLELPGLFKTPAQVDYVYAGLEDTLNTYFQKKGYLLLSLVETGNAYFFSKNNITSFADIKKTKMWLWKGDKLVEEFMNVIQVPAKPINFTEVIPSLQTGLINSFYCTPAEMVALQWHHEVKYMLNLPISYVTGGIVMSAKGWQKLTPKQQTILKEATKKHVKILIRSNRKNSKDTLQVLKTSGIVINASKEPADRITREGKALAARLVGELFPQSLVDKVQALLAKSPK